MCLLNKEIFLTQYIVLIMPHETVIDISTYFSFLYFFKEVGKKVKSYHFINDISSSIQILPETLTNKLVYFKIKKNSFY